jgi:hypothetical protein
LAQEPWLSEIAMSMVEGKGAEAARQLPKEEDDKEAWDLFSNSCSQTEKTLVTDEVSDSSLDCTDRELPTLVLVLLLAPALAEARRLLVGRGCTKRLCPTEDIKEP